MAFLTLVAIMLSGCKNWDYSKAQRLVKEGKYDEAIATFQLLEDYKDSKQQALLATYEKGKYLFETQNYEEAGEVFLSLGEYEDSQDWVTSCTYEQAKVCMTNGQYTNALSLFKTIPDYQDSVQKKREAAYLMIKTFVGEKGKVYTDVSDSLILKMTTDKAYAVETEKNHMVYVAVQDDKVYAGVLYENFMNGFYGSNSLYIDLDAYSTELDFNAGLLVAMSVGENDSSNFSTGVGSINISAVKKTDHIKLSGTSATEGSLVEIKQENLDECWKDFCEYFPDLLKEIGLTFEDLGFDQLK